MKWNYLIVLVLILLAVLGCAPKPSTPPSPAPIAPAPAPTPASLSDTTPPSAITGLVANNSYDGRVNLWWDKSAAEDFA